MTTGSEQSQRVLRRADHALTYRRWTTGCVVGPFSCASPWSGHDSPQIASARPARAGRLRLRVAGVLSADNRTKIITPLRRCFVAISPVPHYDGRPNRCEPQPDATRGRGAHGTFSWILGRGCRIGVSTPITGELVIPHRMDGCSLSCLHEEIDQASAPQLHRHHAPQGKKWHAETVRRILLREAEEDGTASGK